MTVPPVPRMSESRPSPRLRFTQRITVRPVLFTLSLAGTVVFSAVLLWAIETYATFSRAARQADLKQTVQMQIEHQFATLHLPAVLDMASGISAADGLRRSLSRRDAAEIDRILTEAFRQKYVASGRIVLLSLTAFDKNLVPIAAKAARSFPGVRWENFLAGVADRKGLEWKQIAAKYMLDSEGNPLHVMIFPIGALRTAGYLGIVTSPLPALDGLARTLGVGVAIKSMTGRELLVQPFDSSTQRGALDLLTHHGVLDPFAHSGVQDTRVYDAVGTSFITSDRTELFRLTIETEVTAYEHAATHVKRISYAVALGTILVVWAIGLWLLRATLFRRISRLSSALRRLAAGDRRVEVPWAGGDEIGRMSEDLKTVVGYVSEMVTLKESQSRTNAKLNEEIDKREAIEVDLRSAKEQAEIGTRAKSEFLATMSHELRTPLNAIIGFSEIIGAETFGPVGSVKYREYASDIHESGRHLLDLINDILDLSKVESGMDELHEEDVDVFVVADSVFRLVRQRADKHGVKLKSEISDESPTLRVDERKLKQMLVNLLSNAIKFTKAGGTVTLKGWCRMESGYVFQVIDTGIGIALEDIPKALSQFGQVDSALNRQHEGTGLGLPLTKSLVELHGGSLDLQSDVGVGTTVTLRFPAERIVGSPRDAKSAIAAGRKAG